MFERLLIVPYEYVNAFTQLFTQYYYYTAIVGNSKCLINLYLFKQNRLKIEEIGTCQDGLLFKNK